MSNNINICSSLIYKVGFKELFSKLKDKRTIIVFLILITIALMSSVLKQIFVALIFIAVASFSKIYHRFSRSSLGIDLVLYTTLMIALIYQNLMLSLTVAWLGLIMADMVSQRFNYTSIVSLLGLTAVVLLSGLFTVFPLIYALIGLMLIYEIIASSLYMMMGSSINRILVFISSHLIFNLIIITGLTDILRTIM